MVYVTFFNNYLTTKIIPVLIWGNLTVLAVIQNKYIVKR